MEYPFETVRNSRMDLNEVFFWTSTIKDWKHLLKQDKYCNIIITTLKNLVSKGQISVYGLVIMPNHIHLLWELLEMNGKEMPHASFSKATAHEIVKDLKKNHKQVLPYFAVSEKERSFRIWQRDPLAVLIDSRNKFEQKLDYIHNNPLHERWRLGSSPELYPWSSASFYESGVDPFSVLTHYRDRF